MTLSERIQTILDETGVDSVTLGHHAGVSKGTVSQWLSGQIKSIKLEYAVGIQNALGYNPVWIVMGKGNKKTPGVEHNEIEWNPLPVAPSRAIPVLGMAQLGDNGFWADIEYPVGQGDGFVDFSNTQLSKVLLLGHRDGPPGGRHLPRGSGAPGRPDHRGTSRPPTGSSPHGRFGGFERRRRDELFDYDRSVAVNAIVKQVLPGRDSTCRIPP